MPHLDRTTKETESTEVNRPAETSAPDADPDKLVLPEGMERTRDATEFRNLNDSLKSQMEDGQIDKRKKERMPPQERFEGTAGNSHNMTRSGTVSHTCLDFAEDTETYGCAIGFISLPLFTSSTNNIFPKLILIS